MKKTTLLALLAALPFAAHALNCDSTKAAANCRQPENLVRTVSAATAAPEDDIDALWRQSEAWSERSRRSDWFGSDVDMDEHAAASAPAAKTAGTAEKPAAATAAKTQVKLRQTALINKPARVVKVAQVAPAKPVLSRRQALEQEIRREKTALKSAEAALSAARSKGDSSAAQRFTLQINDRRLNIAAMESELRR